MIMISSSSSIVGRAHEAADLRSPAVQLARDKL